MNIRAGLVGITGYTGMELARILATHPNIKLSVATSREQAGQKLEQIYPFLRGLAGGDLTLIEPDPKLIAEQCDIAFLAVPHGTAMDMAAALIKLGKKVVDLSADFRLKNKDTYATWYGEEHKYPNLLPFAVYGLPELNASAIAKASLIANPGCYPTSAILGLYPSLFNELIETQPIIIDSKSGTSGAGRSANSANLFCEVSDTFRAYSLGKHRHTPEIEQELTNISRLKNLTQQNIENFNFAPPLKVTFSPHLVPMNRGILSTIYATLKPGVNLDQVQRVYEQFYTDHKFVRTMPKGKLPETRNVRGTMFCDLGLVVDERTNQLIIVSVIDNLCRGASGQAIANANLMFELPLDCGLNFVPLMP